ncbi:K+/H+ antiporter subunit F [Aquimonas voraii]|uniref:Multisubunit potassium/proton antiporter, PhaF subunit n=1 Tax=Aquimonas voraii TaxID=265719 RepID=A0A1G6Z4R3_9GAMM|nr:K+/H+ antiporter subunit F [Aquimonas voraii]SDD97754.1 multisubunit potassium/proton antiporter, PhaF subunit [Aquimonas voraii]
MIDTVIGIVMGMLLLALALAAWRLLRGPAVEDRILAIDTMYINTIALLMLLGMWLRSDIYFEAVLVIAMLGFVGTLALSRYVMRRDIIE